MHIPKELRAPLAAQFLVFMIVLSVFSTGMMYNAHTIKEAVFKSCNSRNVNASETNKVLDKLIENAQKSAAFKSEEKMDRMAGWAALRIQLEVCVAP